MLPEPAPTQTPDVQPRAPTPVAQTRRGGASSPWARPEPARSHSVRLAARGGLPALSFVITRDMGTVVVTVHGLLGPDSSQALGDALRDLIDQQGNLAVVVDLRDLSLADPSCLGVFAAAAAAAARRGGELTLADPPEAVARALTLAGLARAVRASGRRAPMPAPGADGPRESHWPRLGMPQHPAGSARPRPPQYPPLHEGAAP